MKNQTILVSLIAVFTVLTLLTLVAATDCDDYINTDDVVMKINGQDISQVDQPISIDAGDTVTVDLSFTACEDIDTDNVKIKAWLSGTDSDVIDTTDKFKMFAGRTYIKHFSLTVPSTLKDLTDELTLYIRFTSEDSGDLELDPVDLTIQRTAYNVDVLSIDSATSVTAGSQLAVNIVIKNRGLYRLDDTFVKVSIPEIGAERNVFFGDLTATDGKTTYCVVDEDDEEESIDCSTDEDTQDAVERTAYLTIPANAKAGTYQLEVKVSNDDVTAEASKTVQVTGSEDTLQVLPSATSKTVASGATATFDLILVNSGSKLKIFNIVPEQVSNLNVEASDSIVTVSADSSKTVRISATPSKEGSYSFAVNVMSDNEVVKRVPFTLTAEGKAISVANPVVILTVVLAIIFVVLLVVLIVLLTRKPETTEEETSYY